MASESFVTLATNDSYAIGALTWASSLRQVNTKKKITILITKDLSSAVRNALSDFFDFVQEVDLFETSDTTLLEALKRPELSVTLTKIHCWKLTQFSKCVFMDADTIVIKNIDELFDKEELSAVADIGWPDCFNSGVFVFTPSEKTFTELEDLASKEGSFDGGDQGLLNQYFSDWATKDISRHLSFIYNMSLASSYTYPPAFIRFGDRVKVIHFLGSLKPWHYNYNANADQLLTPCANNQAQFIKRWWQIFASTVHPSIEKLNLVGSLANMSVSPPPSAPNENRLDAWKDGRIDYLGADAFENIQRKLDQSINQ